MNPQPAPGTDPFDFPRLCRSFSEGSPQPMLAVEGESHIVRYLNPAFARLAGRSTDELIGRPFAEAVVEGAANRCIALLDRVYRTGTPGDLAEQLHAQTSPVAVHWSYFVWPIFGGDGRPAGVMIQVTDASAVAAFRSQATAVNEALVVSSVRQHELIDTIERGESERRELEAKVFQARKVESLGVLAGGIAHDLNNMLTPVMGYAQLAAEALPRASPVRTMLDEVCKNARRAADLVLQILAFAGKGRFVLEPVDFSDLVRELDGLLKSSVSPDAELRYDLAPDLPSVKGDVTQLRQVIINLVLNASESLASGGGIITVRTLASGPSVVLEVTDTGCGMTPDVIEKVFDPFFSTKFTGRGLGLAVVQGITRGHGGTLEVRSEPGKGSAFTFSLPATKERAEVEPMTITTERWRGVGTILVVDDEVLVRGMVARILEIAGLTVLLAADGAQSLDMLRRDPRGIDAVLLDMTMPGMDGLETANALRRIRPALPIVLMSGYSIKEWTLQSAGLCDIEFVQKPFVLASLFAAMRRALGQ